jgi:hypothetical protein
LKAGAEFFPSRPRWTILRPDGYDGGNDSKGTAAIGKLYSATASLPGLNPGPDAADEAAYHQAFPYYAELCALSEIRKKPGFDVPLRSGIGGHALLYLNGVRRDRSAGHPRLALCEPGIAAARGVGISVNAHYRNANWVAADGPDFLWRGALAPGESLTRAGYARTQERAKALDVLDGVEFHEHFFRGKPAAMAPRDYMYEISIGTDYAARFGRDVFRARVPLDHARMAAVVTYLNHLNQPYRDGGRTFDWKLFTNNCCHVAHNALAAAGIWPAWPTGTPAALAAFNFPVPKNEFVDLVLRANDLPVGDPLALYNDLAARRALLESGAPPSGPGALVIAAPAIRDNEVYDIERLKLIFYDNPFWGAYQTRLARILSEPRFTNLHTNMKHFSNLYAAARVNRSAIARLPDQADARQFAARYAAHIARAAAMTDQWLAGSDPVAASPVAALA